MAGGAAGIVDNEYETYPIETTLKGLAVNCKKP
jgi:hypothetical protein